MPQIERARSGLDIQPRKPLGIECQAARNVDSLSASNLHHPPVDDQRLACPALAGLQRVGRVRVMGIFGFSFESGF
jgi:hypothetical protein